MIYYCFLMQSKGANLEGNGKNKEKTKKCIKNKAAPHKWPSSLEKSFLWKRGHHSRRPMNIMT